MPDLTYPGQVCGMTGQHAQRQGKLVARNVAASLGHGTRKEYKHDDLGLLVDLGGLAAAANPLDVPCPDQRPMPWPVAITCTLCPAIGCGFSPTGP